MQARRNTQACVGLDYSQAGSACAPRGGQRHGQSGAPAQRGGWPAAAVRCPPRARGPPSAA
eukprot:6205408-Pleurochrysis_carterae.AAC.3